MKHTLYILLFVLIFAPVNAALARDSFLDIQEVVSDSGIKAWLVEDHSVPIISIEFTFKGAGAYNDPMEKQGLSRLVSNTMDEGAGEYSAKEFQETLNDNSIGLSFSSSRDNFSGSLKTLSRNKFLAYKLMALALSEPRFDQEALERMRDANKSRIKSSLSDPNWIAARIMNDKLYGDHPYSKNSGGTLSSLDQITTEDLRSFQQTQFGKSNLYIGVSGDITPEELKSTLDVIFGNLPEKPSRPQEKIIATVAPQNQGSVFVYEQDIPQTIVQMMQPGIDRHDPDFQTAQVMNHILGASGFGSRLTKSVREERGLTYGIYTYLIDMAQYDALGLSTSTKNESAGEMLSLIGKEWKAMKNAPAEEKEVEDTKSYLNGSLPLAFTSTDRIAAQLLDLQVDGLPIDYFDQRKKAIEAVTPAEVQRVAKEILNADAMTTVLVGKPQEIDGAIEIKELPNAK